MQLIIYLPNLFLRKAKYKIAKIGKKKTDLALQVVDPEALKSHFAYLASRVWMVRHMQYFPARLAN